MKWHDIRIFNTVQQVEEIHMLNYLESVKYIKKFLSEVESKIPAQWDPQEFNVLKENANKINSLCEELVQILSQQESSPSTILKLSVLQIQLSQRINFQETVSQKIFGCALTCKCKFIVKA